MTTPSGSPATPVSTPVLDVIDGQIVVEGLILDSLPPQEADGAACGECIGCMEEAIHNGEPVNLTPLRLWEAHDALCICDPSPTAPCDPACAVC